MNLLDIASKDGRSYKRVSSNHGGEYHGPCPVCAGNDRFHVWPEQGDHGTFWCRACGLGGDAIEYLMKIEGKPFPVACKEVGKELAEQEEYQVPQFKRPVADTFTPRELATPADLWIQHAEKFVEYCHLQLLAGGDGKGSPLAYLADRGITRETATKYRLGWNPGKKGNDDYRPRKAWGLEDIVTDGKSKTKIWLPIGITIPRYVDATLRAIQIRIPNERRTERYKLPYWPVPGSVMNTFVTDIKARSYVVVEAALCAILIDQCAGDITGAMATGNSTAKPTSEAFSLLQSCIHISNALDYDAEITLDGKYKNPGGVGWLWWKKHFPQAERWPVPVGKDPGDAFKAGIDIREWVKAGLPPVMTMPKTETRPVKVETNPAVAETAQDNSGSGSTAPATGGEPAAPIVYNMTAKDGRTYHITDDKTEYTRLIAAGKIVFDSKELALVKQSGANQEQAASFLDFKQTFPGIRISDVQPDVQAVESARPTWNGKYNKEQP